MKNGPYIMLVAPANYPGKKYRGRYAYEHHIKWWKKHNLLPKKGYEIHHKNGDHQDNRMCNLQMVTASEHAKLHGLKRTLAATKTMKCAFCKKFNVVGKQSHLNYRFKKNGNRIFCGRSCQVKMQWREGKANVLKKCSKVP